jgi:hypothetical protein
LVSSLSFIPSFIDANLPIHAASLILRGQFSLSVLLSRMFIVIVVWWEHVLKCFAKALVPWHFIDEQCVVVLSFNFLVVCPT